MTAKKKPETPVEPLNADTLELPVGTAWEIPEGADVERPDGLTVSTIGGLHVLDVPGTYRVNDESVTAV